MGSPVSPTPLLLLASEMQACLLLVSELVALGLDDEDLDESAMYMEGQAA